MSNPIEQFQKERNDRIKNISTNAALKAATQQFNIESIYDAIIQKFCFSEEILKKLSEKPIDIITLFYFLDNSHYFFHIGNALIVGNGELSIVDINTLSLLQGNHYKVYLISTLYEKYIDFFELIYFGKITYPKKNK